MSLAQCYGTLSTPFGELGPFYDSLGHRGADYRRAAGQPILAYDDMEVEYVGRSAGLGGVIGLRRLGLGGFAGFAHVVGAAKAGTVIELGEPLAWVAGWDDDHGSLWSGPHIHTTDSASSAYNAAIGVRPLRDPAPLIARAISSSPASLAPVALNHDLLEEEEMEPFIITLNDAGVKYLYRPATRSKRSISKEEWSVMKKGNSAGVPLRVVKVTQAELDAIPGK